MNKQLKISRKEAKIYARKFSGYVGSGIKSEREVMSKIIDLSWGHAVCVRSAFLNQVSKRSIVFGPKELRDMNYPSHEGDPDLIEITKKVIERQVGPTYNHILLTNGATGGVTLALRAYAKRGHNIAFTRIPPYFPIYPEMIASAGLVHKIEADIREDNDNPVALIDSPTNPQGIAVGSCNVSMPIVWDAVYQGRVYTSGNHKPLGCDVLVGSYSKLLGLNGLRTGWIATNDELLYLRLKDLVTAEYCGLSSASTTILLQLLSQVEDNNWWDQFERAARYNLDHNRGEWRKLEKYFNGHEVSPNGMFYYAHMDGSAKKLISKSNIIWTSGSSLGTDDSFARFNLGQDCKLVRDAVKEILKNDRR